MIPQSHETEMGYKTDYYRKNRPRNVVPPGEHTFTNISNMNGDCGKNSTDILTDTIRQNFSIKKITHYYY